MSELTSTYDLASVETDDEGLLTSRRARPFLKWAGGKGRLLPTLTRLLPASFRQMRYLEPFLGGGAMFFGLAPQRAILSDVNADLVATYGAVRDDHASVLGHLTRLEREHGRHAYYETRARYNRDLADDVAERAAMFIYLNRTCFNGLHRVNKHGHFNVPMGRYVSPKIVDAAALRAASAWLGRAQLRCATFEEVLEQAGRGDFVYLDPPYAPVSSTACFTTYARGGFGDREQERLREVYRELDRRGALLMLSNSDVSTVRVLYRDFQVDEVWCARSVNSRSDARGGVRELVIRNYVAAVAPSAQAELW